DEAEAVLRELAARQLKIGLISNSHRSMDEFVEHFQLHGLVAAAVSSAEHGYLKPHPSIFEAALSQAGVEARASLMVGDSLTHDVHGARNVGMRGVLLHRHEGPLPDVDVPVGIPHSPARAGRSRPGMASGIVVGPPSARPWGGLKTALYVLLPR